MYQILLDCDRRVFQVIGNNNTQVFCNLEQINEVVTQINYQPIQIFHFWNNKQTKVTSKYLKELYQANNLTQTFIY